MKRNLGYIALFGMIFFYSCEPEEFSEVHDMLDREYVLDLPAGFPYPNIPEDNQLTQSRVELGRALFYDTRLSGDNSISCASCHQQNLAFTDKLPQSIGVNGGIRGRNAPSLFNVAYQPRLMMDGGVPNLELQVLAPIHDEKEMDSDILEIAEMMQADEYYSNLSWKAYSREADPYVITRALSAFQRTLISGNSGFDKYSNGLDAYTLNERELQGMELFFSERTQCSNCHSGFNFSDGLYHNIGLYDEYQDTGRERITIDPNDVGKFKTPSLRNVAITGPYMHDGSMETLEEVIEFFDQGGGKHDLKDDRVRPLELNKGEKIALIAFLNRLTDWEATTAEAYSKP